MSFRRRRFRSEIRRATPAALAARVALLFLCIAVTSARAERLTVDLPGPVISIAVEGGAPVVESPRGTFSSLQFVHGRLGFSEAHRISYRGEAVDPIPHGSVTADGTRRSAWLGGPTDRYAHGVLGDRVEATRLYVAPWSAEQPPVFLELGPDAVFEDLRPRFVDVDGDGEAEILVVKSYLTTGAAAAVYRVRGSRIEPVAETAAIGTANRWLNPVGVADFDGDGRPELAVVVTPHIGGVLTLYHLANGAFRRIASLPGVSNHAIGSQILQLSAIADFDGDGTSDIALPSADRRSLRLISFRGGALREIGRIDAGGPVTGAVGAADIDGNGRPDLIFGLDGRLAVELR